MNGIDAFKKIREQGCMIPIVAQTAYAFSDEVRRIKSTGFSDYIAKPIAGKDLYKLLIDHLNILPL